MNPTKHLCYLSGHGKDYTADLYHDNSGELQRWLLSGSDNRMAIRPIGGYKITASNLYLGMRGSDTRARILNQQDHPVMYYYIYMDSSEFYEIRVNNAQAARHLYCPSFTSHETHLIHNTVNFGNLDKWSFTSIDQYELRSIQYYVEPGDIARPLADHTEQVSINNNTAIVQNMAVQFTQKPVIVNKFSDVRNKTLNTIGSLTVGVPAVNAGNILENQMAVTTQFAVSSQQLDSRPYNTTVNVPAYTNYRVILKVARYEATATYIATYWCRQTGREIKLKGKWTGTTASEVSYDIVNASNNETVTTVHGPQNAIILTP